MIETLEILEVSMNFIGKLIDMIPDFDQKKRQKFYFLKAVLRMALNMESGKGQDDIIPNLIEEIKDFQSIFYGEIYGRLQIK